MRRILFTVPPHITPFDFGQDTMNAGESASLYCSVNKGDSPIDIEWFLNGKPVKNFREIIISRHGKKASILNIDSVQAEHIGKYTCRATNWAGTAFFTTDLNVNGTRFRFDFDLLFLKCAAFIPIRLRTILKRFLENGSKSSRICLCGVTYRWMPKSRKMLWEMGTEDHLLRRPCLKYVTFPKDSCSNSIENCKKL